MVLESGPFWDPDRDWVSDEAGQHKLYWTAPRVIGGEDPVELGKNNSGHGVGGSMIHYAGYTPRFHPSDFETRTRDGVGADWPISYADLKPHYERVERELPVAGQDWPWGDPHRYMRFPIVGELRGRGFGLAGGLILEPSPLDRKNSIGELFWGGMAGTQWWISPKANVAGLMMTQRQMAFFHPFAFEFKRLAYDAVKRTR